MTTLNERRFSLQIYLKRQDISNGGFSGNFRVSGFSVAAPDEPGIGEDVWNSPGDIGYWGPWGTPRGPAGPSLNRRPNFRTHRSPAENDFIQPSGRRMAKTNYGYEKRQRDLARKKKQEEKLARKREKKAEKAGEGEPKPENGENAAAGNASENGTDIGGEGGEG